MKLLLFTLLTVFSSVSIAEQISLVRTSKQGVSIIDVFEKKNGIYYFSGRDMGKNLKQNVLSDWNSLFTLASKLRGAENINTCYSGTYHLTIEGYKNQKKSVLQGCLEDESYAQVLKKAHSLRKQAALK